MSVGRGAALELARLGHKVVATAETWTQVRTLRADAAAAGVTLEVIKLNLLDKIDIAHAGSFDPDVLVLNAGVMEGGSVVDIPMQRVRESFDINLFGHLALVQAIAPKMVARKAGKIVWTSSMGGVLVVPFLGVYCATKHAIEGIAGSMNAELAPYGIKVATVNPGVFDTGFNDTGAESYVQGYNADTAVVPMPDFSGSLAGFIMLGACTSAVMRKAGAAAPAHPGRQPCGTLRLSLTAAQGGHRVRPAAGCGRPDARIWQANMVCAGCKNHSKESPLHEG